jgi:hypothetical protein
VVFGVVQVLYSLIGIFIMTGLLGRYHKRSPIERTGEHMEEEAKQQTASTM